MDAIATIPKCRELAFLQNAKRQIEKCRTVDEAKDIINSAEAARVYIRKSKMGLDIQNAAAETKLRAERRLGEILLSMGDRRGRKSQNRQRDGFRVDVEESMSRRVQRQALVPPKEFERHIEAVVASRKELTCQGVLRLAPKRITEPKSRKRKAVALPGEAVCVGSLAELGERKYGCIYADPPWRYDNSGTRASAKSHYATMTVDELCGWPVKDYAADAAHLHLWTTNAFLPHSFKVIEAWGFEYKSCFVWTKQMGIGNYWRVSHEFLLLGVRGSGVTFKQKNHKSYGYYPRGEHSSKPEAIRGIVEQCSPGPFLELFGRRVIPGWSVVGNAIRRSPQKKFA